MTLYVVRCYMEGCEECGDEYHIVGVFSSEKLAKEAYKRHLKYKHLHYNSIAIAIVTLDTYIKSYREDKEGFVKKEWWE